MTATVDQWRAEDQSTSVVSGEIGKLRGVKELSDLRFLKTSPFPKCKNESLSAPKAVGGSHFYGAKHPDKARFWALCSASCVILGDLLLPAACHTDHVEIINNALWRCQGAQR